MRTATATTVFSISLLAAAASCGGRKPPPTPERTTTRTGALAGPRDLTFRITGVQVGVEADDQNEVRINMTTDWDIDPPDTMFPCGPSIARQNGPSVICNQGFNPYPDYLEEHQGVFIDYRLAFEHPEGYRRRKRVDLADGPQTLRVNLHLDPVSYWVSIDPAFTLIIDPATGSFTPTLPQNPACGFRHDGRPPDLPNCGAPCTDSTTNPRPNPPCSAECVVLDLGWQVCYTVDSVCVPTGIPDINCDGVDDDCDGTPDQGFTPRTAPCGPPGACSGTTTISCVNGTVVAGPCQGITPPAPVDLCDGIDNDCNGATDEDFPVQTTPCGPPGPCSGTVTTQCLNGQVVSGPCLGITPPAPVDLCDGVDNDCNGAVDEDFPVQTSVCGPAGACAGTVTISCQNGQIVNSGCVGITPPTPERPDNVDNDCDGQTDECTSTDWWCACVPNTDMVFRVDLNDDGGDANAEAERCLPGALATGQCRLRGVFRRAEQLATRGCRVVAQLDARTFHVDSELRLGLGNLLVQGTDREATIVTATGACANAPACTTLTCEGAGTTGCETFPQTCSVQVGHRLINAIAQPGRAPALELRTLTLRSGNTRLPASNVPEDSGGGVVLTGGQLVITDSIVRDNRANGHGSGVAVYNGSLLRLTDSVVRDNLNNQTVTGCHPTGPGGGRTADGGGVFAQDTATVEITRSAIVNNRTADAGGAAIYGDGRLTILNSTFTGNEASGRGGALVTTVNTELAFTTIVGNVAAVTSSVRGPAFDVGGGIRVEAFIGRPQAPFAAFGNIIADNALVCGVLETCLPVSPDCSLESGTGVTGDNNLVGVGGLDCVALANPATDPAFVGTAGSPIPSGTLPLPVGGPQSAATQVLVLDSGNAIGAYPPAGLQNPGTPSCPPDDQTRALREPAFVCSLGAYEVNIVANADGDWIEADIDTQPAVFSNGFSDVGLFGATTGTVTDRGNHTVSIHDAASFADGVTVGVSAGGGTAPARISACGGTQVVSIPPGQQRTITCPRPTSCFFSSLATTLADRARLTGELFAGSFSFGIDTRLTGPARSTGNGFLGDRAVITGDATLRGVLTGNRAGVLGRLTERANVAAQALLARAGTGGSGTIDVPAGSTRTLTPGAHGQVTVRAGATLALAASGIYRFTALTFEPDAHLDLLAAATQAVVAVDGALTLGDRVRTGTGTATPLQPGRLRLFANGQNVLFGHDAVVVGSLEARNARVELQDRGVVTGCVGGRTLVVGHDVRATGP